MVALECIFLMFLSVAFGASDCPCKDPQLCEPIRVIYKKEIFLFSTSNKYWSKYDWSNITTIVMFGYYDAELMCYAHSKGARVILLADFPLQNLSDAAERKRWVDSKVQLAQEQFMDGINIDAEGELNKTMAPLLTKLVEETRDAFHNAMPHSQVTFDVAWSADCIDGRCYDYPGIAKASDYVFVMSYDEQGQIFGDCKAMANSPYNKTAQGVETFLKLGIPPQKMILGVPWYGYDYECLNVSQDDVCWIKHVPYRGVNCSDAAGQQKCYKTLMNWIRSQGIAVKWDDTFKAPFFDFKDSTTGKTHQIWYDNPRSLSLRYDYAKTNNFAGVGMWHSDCLDYETEEGRMETKEMWDTINEFVR